MKEKVLFVSHTSNFAKFNLPYMKWFRDKGYEVHYASAGEEPLPENICCDKEYKIPFNRSPYHMDNVKAYKQLKKIIETEKYEIVHCHTPVGGVVTRLAARNMRKSGTKVLYTAHGFHFYQGAPRQNWMLYYPVEKFLSRYTDCIITLNQEDYQLTFDKHFKAGSVYKIDGVGVDLKRFSMVDESRKNLLREKNNLSPNDFVLIYVAEFIPRKNHELLLNAVSKLKGRIPNLKLLLVGTGRDWELCKERANTLGIADCTRFLGYCRNVDELCAMSDVLVSTSWQEGLPIGVIEGMACGLPIACTKIRGQIDVIQDGENGRLYMPGDVDDCQDKIFSLYENLPERQRMAKNNIRDVQRYSLENALVRMEEIYTPYMSHT
ncbi:glycosyltransferase family 4 protein [Scatolibacter rhodanostii]|uniref:glycosyltransferase family 4 protein n=1 Tax=Scatolibacter rhodanostii TaxID=2014781 RepID=UPI000C07A18B|nr:glycosyltransferase family 4 protein [Scatolibacter rhodanostii]